MGRMFQEGTVTPEEQGLDSQMLAVALRRAQEQELRLHSLIILRNGRRLLDVSLFPFGPNQVHGVASVTKSVTSTLVAIALRLGYLKGLDQRLVELLPGRMLANRSADKESITLKNLLTMSSGLLCVNQPTEQTLYDMRASADWVQFVLDLPVTDVPGSRFAYHSAASHLLSAVLEQATGRTLLEFGRQHLFGALGFGALEWPADPQGHTRGWGHLQLLPQDMARLGQLHLNDGVWEGQRLLPQGWVAEATRKHLSALPQEDGYGYLWWIPASGGYQASGLGGQAIAVRPDLRLVVVTNGSGRSERTKAWIRTSIVPAIRSDTALPANPTAYRELQWAADALARPPATTPLAALPQAAEQISQRTFGLSPNSLGWQTMALRFTEGRDTAQLIRDGDGLPVGLDGVPRLATDAQTGRPVALNGHWENAKTFVLYYDTISQYRTFRLRLSFVDDRLHAVALQYAIDHESEFTGSELW